MMQQRLGWSARDVLFDALVLLLALVFAAAVAAAKPTHVTRVRRSEALQATPDFSRPMRGSRSRKNSHNSRAEAHTKREAEARPVVASSRRRGRVAQTRAERRAEERADRELAEKESRTELRHKGSRRSVVIVDEGREGNRAGLTREARVAREPALARVDAGASKKLIAGVAPRSHADDAAPETETNVAAASDGAYATGVSHPDGDETAMTQVEGDAAGAQQHSVPEVQVSADGDIPVAPPVANAKDMGTPVLRVAQKGVTDHADVDPLPKSLHAEMAQDAIAPRLPGLFSREGKLIVPAPLRGSREILVHQNEMADAAGLNRIRTDAQLDNMRAHHLLVNFSETAGLHVNPNLPADRRCARPWTVQFAQETAKEFYARFHEPLELNSAVRTVAYQRRLQRVNGNAAAVDGDGASPHLTGQALDFGKRGMSLTEIAWMRAYLLPLMQSGKLDVEEEFQQACFHISVYRGYVRGGKIAAARGEVAEVR